MAWMAAVIPVNAAVSPFLEYYELVKSLIFTTKSAKNTKVKKKFNKFSFVLFVSFVVF